MQPIKVHELTPPTCVLLLSKNFDPSLFFNVAPSLSMSMSNLYCPCPCPCPTSTSFLQCLPKLSYLCTISPPLSSISIKGVLLIDAKVCIWGKWLRLESCIFVGHHLIVGMTLLVALEIPHIESLTLIPICGTPPPISYHGSFIC